MHVVMTRVDATVEYGTVDVCDTLHLAEQMQEDSREQQRVVRGEDDAPQ